MLIECCNYGLKIYLYNMQVIKKDPSKNCSENCCMFVSIKLYKLLQTFL